MDSHQTMRIANLQTMPRGKRSAIALRASNGGHSACSRDGKPPHCAGAVRVLRATPLATNRPLQRFFFEFSARARAKAGTKPAGQREGGRTERPRPPLKPAQKKGQLQAYRISYGPSVGRSEHRGCGHEMTPTLLRLRLIAPPIRAPSYAPSHRARVSPTYPCRPSSACLFALQLWIVPR